MSSARVDRTGRPGSAAQDPTREQLKAESTGLRNALRDCDVHVRKIGEAIGAVASAARHRLAPDAKALAEVAALLALLAERAQYLVEGVDGISADSEHGPVDDDSPPGNAAPALTLEPERRIAPEQAPDLGATCRHAAKLCDAIAQNADSVIGHMDELIGAGSDDSSALDGMRAMVRCIGLTADTVSLALGGQTYAGGKAASWLFFDEDQQLAFAALASRKKAADPAAPGL